MQVILEASIEGRARVVLRNDMTLYNVIRVRINKIIMLSGMGKRSWNLLNLGCGYVVDSRTQGCVFFC